MAVHVQGLIVGSAQTTHACLRAVTRFAIDVYITRVYGNTSSCGLLWDCVYQTHECSAAVWSNQTAFEICSSAISTCLKVSMLAQTCTSVIHLVSQ